MNESLKEQSVKLAYAFANRHKKYVCFFDSFDDYTMSLILILLQKLKNYDNNVAAFSTYAYTVMLNYIKRKIAIRNYKKNNAIVISLDECIETDDDDADKIPRSEIIAYEDESYDNFLNNELYSYLFSHIKKYLTKEFIEHYAYKKTFTQIAKEKHVSKQCVNDRVLKDLEFIQHYIKTGELLFNNNSRLKKLAKELNKLLPEIKELQKIL